MRPRLIEQFREGDRDCPGHPATRPSRCHEGTPRTRFRSEGPFRAIADSLEIPVHVQNEVGGPCRVVPDLERAVPIPRQL